MDIARYVSSTIGGGKVTMYKVTYLIKGDKSGEIHTSTTNAEGVEGMLDNPGLEVFGYIKVKEDVENEKNIEINIARNERTYKR